GSGQPALSAGGLAVRMPQPVEAGSAWAVVPDHSCRCAAARTAPSGHASDAARQGGIAMNLAAGQRGLTLIEVLVALVVMAVLSLMTWGSLDSLQRTQGDLEERSMRIQAVLAVLEQFERDVQWRAGTEFSEQGWLFPPVATEAGGAAQTPAPLFLPPSVL